jgi:hypothetical protein
VSGQPHPKPEKRKRKQIRHVDSKATTRAVLRWTECATCPEPSATGHHVLARGGPYFGDDLEENIVALCGSGTTGCHGKLENEDATTRVRLGVHLIRERPDVLEYLDRKLGEVPAREWLSRRLYVAVADA